MLASYAAIACPTLIVKAEPDTIAAFWGDQFSQATFMQRIQQVPHLQLADVADAGHMLHHDQPQVLATLVETFLAAP